MSIVSLDASDFPTISDVRKRQLEALEERGIDAYVAPGRAKHAADGEGGGERISAMREKIRPAAVPLPIAQAIARACIWAEIKAARGSAFCSVASRRSLASRAYCVA